MTLIVIDNFTNGETVNYPLIILKGHINVSSPSNINKILLKHYEYENFTYTTNFKFIIKLKEGINDININYNCDKILFNLNYVPYKNEYTVYPLYIICREHDGQFQAPETQDNTQENACKRINLICQMLQSVTAEKLYEKSNMRKCFNIEKKCQIFHTSLLYSDIVGMNEKELWEYLAREIMKSDIGNDKRKYLGFLSCTRYHGEKFEESFKKHEDLIKLTDGYIALGGGGLALFGTASLYTWPESFENIIKNFEDQTIVDKTKLLDDSCYRGTFGACFSTSFGSVLHELCHTFDLGHTETGIMARGFDNIYKVFVTNSDINPDISSKFFSNIEFKESLEPKLLSERLKNAPKESKIISLTKFNKEKDDTFWTESCATILNYHRWFNNFPETTKYILKFDVNTGAFTSTAGLRVVEIRRLTDELVLIDWVFTGKILKYSFQIPLESTVLENSTNYLIFAEDNVGNIIKSNYYSTTNH